MDAPGEGLERPFDVRFGPDGAMYVVDYGTARINLARTAQGQVPYEFPPATGAVWRITPPDGEAATLDTNGADETATGTGTPTRSTPPFPSWPSTSPPVVQGGRIVVGQRG